MKNATYRIMLDINNNSSQMQFTVKQNDTARKLYILLTENGAPYIISKGSRAIINIKRPGKETINNDCDIRLTDSTIIYEFNEITANTLGLNECELKLYDQDNDLITTPRFTMLVCENVYNDGQLHGINHSELLNKNDPDQHNIDSISGLNKVLADKANNTDIAKLSQELQIERSRINGIASLPEGSTTGDAELVDIRVAADGTTYETAGEAVRAQVNVLKAVDDELKSDLSVLNDTVKINELRKRYAYKIPYLLPDGYIGKYRPVNIFYDGVNFSTDYNKDNFKHKGGNTFFVKPSGNGSTDGSTREKATNLLYAYNHASDGDTIVFTEGLYVFYNGMGTAIQNFPYNFTKSINIIGEGDAKIICGGVGSFTLDSETNLYKFTLTNNSCGKIISRDLSYEYTRVTSIADCQSNTKSFYTSDGSNLYINDSVNPSDNVYLLYTFELFKAHNTASQKIYLENLTIVGSGCCFDINEADGTINEVIAESCNFMYCANENANFRVRGGKTLLHSCKSIGARNDGFAYMGFNKDSEPVGTEFIEIDCIGAFNGIGASGNYQNGTTSHEHCHGIRINGSYYCNQGGNITDVQADCQTVNLGCVAYDSKSTTDFYNQGISIQQAGAEMWCESCLSWGNKYDIYLYPDSSMHLNNCVFDTKATEGTFENTNQRDTEYFIRRKYFA